MKIHDGIAAIFGLILVYLLVVNAAGTQKVIDALGKGVRDNVVALQGRG